MSSNYPELLNEYLDFCTLREQANITKKLDLSNVDWIYPSKLLPSVSFLKNNPNIKLIPPKIEHVKNYFNTVLSGKIRYTLDKTYLPLITLPNRRNDANPIIQRLQQLCENGKNLGGIMAFGYFLGEMIDNIYDHSQFANAYVFAQTYPKMKFSEISIIDDGISIQGSYRKAAYSFTEDQALLKAIEGISTKDTSRGFGLRTNVKLFTEGLKGEFIIVSGGAALYVDKNDKKVFKLQTSQSLQGTFITVRLPYPAKEVNIYDYVE